MTPNDYILALRAAAPLWAAKAAAGSDFARGKEQVCLSMAVALQQYGRFASPRQQGYADKLLAWLRPRVSPVVQAAAVIAAAPAQLTISPLARTRIVRLFNAAREHGLLRPKIVVTVPITDDRILVTLKPSRPSVEHQCIYVYVGSTQVWIGSIDAANGEFRRRFACTQQHVEALQAFGDDPLSIARAHGHATGNCCFCRRHLSDARSVAMGYGPICAEHFGLYWGQERVEQSVALDANGSVAPQRQSSLTRALLNTRLGTPRPRPVAPQGDPQDEDSFFM